MPVAILVSLQSRVSSQKLLTSAGLARGVVSDAVGAAPAEFAACTYSIHPLRRHCFFFLMIRPPPRSTLFPSTPLFRSSFFQWFADSRNRRLIERLRKAGVNMRSSLYKPQAAAGPFAGKTFVLTGTLPTLKREEIGKAHASTPVTPEYPMPSSALKKKKR